MGRENVIGISSANKGKGSVKENWGNNQGFTLHMFSAIGGEDPSGRTIDADLNNDGNVSVGEVFDYVANNNPTTLPRAYGLFKETPQLYWENADPYVLNIR